MINKTFNFTTPSTSWVATHNLGEIASFDVLSDTSSGLQKIQPSTVTNNAQSLTVTFSSPRTGKLVLAIPTTNAFVGPAVRMGGDAVIGGNTTAPGANDLPRNPWTGASVYGPWVWNPGDPTPHYDNNADTLETSANNS